MTQQSYIIMGVTGCGKSTIGRALAENLNIPFFDGDDYHPESNRMKLRRDIPLNDEDRRPWLETLAAVLEKENRRQGCVLACSALKQHYRDILNSRTSRVHFIYLYLTPETVKRRIIQRAQTGNPLVLQVEKVVKNQFDILEEPESAVKVDATLPIPLILENILAAVRL